MRTLYPSLLAVSLLLSLAACADPKDRATEYDYRQNHPLVIAPRAAVLELTTLDGARLEAFADDYLRRGKSAVLISVGAATAKDAQATAFAQSLAGVLLKAGLRPAELRPQLVIDDASLPVGHARLRYDSQTAELPDCYDWREGPANGPSANFGCNMQRNVGAMVADPHDLLEMREMPPMAGERAADVVTKYNEGKDTASAPMPMQVDTRKSGSK